MINGKQSLILDFSHGILNFHPSNPHFLPTILTFFTTTEDFSDLILDFHKLNPIFTMQIMDLFQTNKHFITQNAHFFDTNTHFSIIISFFFRLIVDFFRIIAYFFTTIVHFSNLIVYFLVDNSKNPDTKDKKQIAFVQATTPIPSLSGTFASPHEPTLQPKACKRACQPIPPNRTLQGRYFD